MNAYINGRVHKKPCIGGTGFSLLLKSGASVGAFNPALSSAEPVKGSGMSKSLEERLSKLAVQPVGRKPKNIVFNI